MKELTQEQLYYIEMNVSIFAVNSSAEQYQRQKIYDMYNDMHGTNKKPNSCGRCWRNVRTAVYMQYLKQKEQ